MNPYTLGMIIFTSVFVGIIVIASYYKEIMSLIRPNFYCKVTILESDNNIRNFLVKKGDDLRFKFKKGLYNLFDSTNAIDNRKTVIYREGRLAKFFFIEGNENPLDFRKIMATGNPQLNFELTKLDLTKIFTRSDNSLSLLFEKYGHYFIIGIVAFFVLFFFIRGGQ